MHDFQLTIQKPNIPIINNDNFLILLENFTLLFGSLPFSVLYET